MKFLTLILAMTWAGLWFTPDQQGKRLFQKGEYEAAASIFQDPMWKGVAQYQAGDFEAAAQTFARMDTAEGHYNQGNAWVLLGKYETAVASYDRALEERPGWEEAEQNRALAQARAEMLKTQGGNMTEGEMGADEIVFDLNDEEGSSEAIESEQSGELSDAEIQALWLQRVRTRPADFLKSKFAYQDAMREEGDSP